ncbi:MAG TPA: hypothetical protein VFG68_10720 [Fimbriiglobus sp.]|nr:hypothetical protein [Fimbriiglobus sp.]
MALRILLLTVWLLVPVVGYALHMGPGQDKLKLDAAAASIRAAEQAAKDNDYPAAVEQYDEALKALPAGRTAEARKVRLEKAKAQMLAKKLPEAHADLKALVDELSADPNADEKLLAEARSATANANYYMTWLMRLEGQSQDVWEPEIESARQTYKLLAEQAEKSGDQAAAQKHREDLEASIRLARMDLGELQGLPLPSQ